MNVDHAGSEEFLFPGGELLLDVVRYHHIMAEAQGRLDAILKQGYRVLNCRGLVEGRIRLFLTCLRDTWFGELREVLVDHSA